MVNKVYILLGGTRDERCVRAVFSTREAAEAALHLGNKEAEIEEHSVDAPMPVAPAGHCLWNVEEFKGYSAVRIEAFGADDIDQVIFDGDSWMVNLWARDEDHALQAGMERIGLFKGKQGVAAKPQR